MVSGAQPVWTGRLSARSRYEAALPRAQLARVEANTVDAFQGRETDVIIFSCVRSSSSSPSSLGGGRGRIGFVADVRRMNVALTRARHAVWVVGNAHTLGHNPVWRQYLEHMRRGVRRDAGHGLCGFHSASSVEDVAAVLANRGAPTFKKAPLSKRQRVPAASAAAVSAREAASRSGRPPLATKRSAPRGGAGGAARTAPPPKRQRQPATVAGAPAPSAHADAWPRRQRQQLAAQPRGRGSDGPQIKGVVVGALNPPSNARTSNPEVVVERLRLCLADRPHTPSVRPADWLALSVCALCWPW